jgi:phosphatidylglycerol:prolipoprotein diacylglycerol transferase
MIDPVIFTIRLGSIAFSVHWYAVFIIAAVLVGTWIAGREVHRRGGDPEHVWDGLTWALPAAVIGARLWFVVSDILGGGTHYVEDPLSILRIWEGGLHYFGALLFGGLVAYVFARKYKVDMWLILDSAAPSLLIGQGMARPANYINQELYGPPTDLPWGISIAAPNRIPPWNDLTRFPEETTRFHPTFAYEMIWNLMAGGLLLWIARRFSDKMKPGAVFAGWLFLAGVGRVLIESFRPDQPRLPGTDLSFSRLVAVLMTVVGAVWLLIRYEVIRLSFLSPGPASYATASAEPEQLASPTGAGDGQA